MQTILMFVPIVAIVLIIAAFLLSIRFKTKSQERKKNELTENLVAYRKKQAEKAMDPNYVMPPTLLENTTFCSDIAVKKFCQFHFFRKNIVQNSIFILLGIVSFVMGIRYDDANWILRIVLLGLGLYLAVQPFLSVDKMVKAEIRVYQRGRSREAHYAFREEDFRVSGPDRSERDWRALWRRFYDTVAIEGRYNPRCRMTHMPKRYWGCMTEFQTDPPEERPAMPEGAE